MIKNEIDQLLAKYWECETTLDEEQILKQYFKQGDVDASHVEFKHLFGYLEDANAVKSNIDLASILGGELKQSERNSIDDLLAEYWSGESSLADEEDLRLYFRSGMVAARHQAYKPFFNYLSREQSKSGVNLDVKELITKESKEKKEAIIRPMGRRLRAVAAGLAILLAAGIGYMTLGGLNDNTTRYAGKVTVLDEKAEQEEALQITKEALAMLSDTFGKGQASVAKDIEQISKLNIFFN